MGTTDKKIRKQKKRAEEAEMSVKKITDDTIMELKTNVLPDAKNLVNEMEIMIPKFKETLQTFSEDIASKGSYIINDLIDTKNRIREITRILEQHTIVTNVDIDAIGTDTMEYLKHASKLPSLITDFEALTEIKPSFG